MNIAAYIKYYFEIEDYIAHMYVADFDKKLFRINYFDLIKFEIMEDARLRSQY